MTPEIILDRAGAWLQEESVSRALALAGTAVVAGLAAGWRLFRRPARPPERVNVVVDAPPGERVDVRVGRKKKSL